MHFSVAVMLRDMPSQLTSIPLNSKGQGLGHLVTFAKGRLVRIFWSAFCLKQLSLVSLLIIFLALLYLMSTKDQLVRIQTKYHIVVSVFRGAIRA